MEVAIVCLVVGVGLTVTVATTKGTLVTETVGLLDGEQAEIIIEKRRMPIHFLLSIRLIITST